MILLSKPTVNNPLVITNGLLTSVPDRETLPSVRNYCQGSMPILAGSVAELLLRVQTARRARPPTRCLIGRPGQETSTGQAGHVASDTSPLRSLRTRTRPVLRPPAVVSPEPSHSGRGPMLGLILHIPTTESKSHRRVASAITGPPLDGGNPRGGECHVVCSGTCAGP
jgi:hypothetical protein